MSNKANRRKGNAQTASSARAAELLQASGISIPFVDLAAVNLTVEGLADSSDTNVEELGAHLDPELRILFKRLSKRDLNTREKSIKELFIEVQTRSKVEMDLKGAWQCYAPIYARLVTDSSAVIRSVANQALAVFVTTLQKEAGALLKVSVPFLLFSREDGSASVAQAADDAFSCCFPDEAKRRRAWALFGVDTVEVCVQIVNRHHKLVAPQKFVEEETNGQRQVRLIAQALRTLEASLSHSDLAEAIARTFISTTAFNSLMSLDAPVKAAAFRLLNSLLRNVDSTPVFATKIPSFVLQNLDSPHPALAQHAFQCFIVLGRDDRFYDNCRLEKAVIPKFVSMIRKKGLHWTTLERFLVEGFDVICEKLAPERQTAFMDSMLESFFDGVEPGIPIHAWAETLNKTLRFFTVTIPEREGVSQEDGLKSVADYTSRFLSVVLAYGDSTSRDTFSTFFVWLLNDEKSRLPTAIATSLKAEIQKKVVYALPKSMSLAQNLFPVYAQDQSLLIAVLESSNCPSDAFVDIVTTHGAQGAVNLKPTVLASRLNAEQSPSLLRKLVPLLQAAIESDPASGKLEDLIKINDRGIAIALVETCTEKSVKTLSLEARKIVLKALVTVLLSGTSVANPENQRLFLTQALPSDEASRIVKQLVKAAKEDLDVEGLVRLTNVAQPLFDQNRELPDYVLRLLTEFCLYQQHGVDQNTLQNAQALASCLDSRSFGLIIDCLVAESAPVQRIPVVARMFALMPVDVHKIASALPSTDELVGLCRNLTAKYGLCMAAEEGTTWLLEAAATKVQERDVSADFSVGAVVRKAYFLAVLMREAQKVLNVTEIAVFGPGQLYCVLAVLLVRFKADIGLFHVQVGELDALQGLKKIQEADPASDVYNTAETEAAILSRTNEDETVLLMCVLREVLQKTAAGAQNPTRATALGLESTEGLESSLRALIAATDHMAVVHASNPEEAVHFLDDFLTNNRAEYETWLFSVIGEDPLKDMVATAFLRLAAVMYKNGYSALTPPMKDFFLCGFMSLLQALVDLFREPEKRGLFTPQLAAVFASRFFRTVNDVMLNATPEMADDAREWYEFYRPSITVLVLTLLRGNFDGAGGFAPFLAKELCVTAQVCLKEEFVTVGPTISVVPQKNVSLPDGLDFAAYPPESRNWLTLAVTEIFNSRAEYGHQTFFALHVFKEFILDMYAVENPVAAPEEAGEDETDVTTIDEQLKADSQRHERKLPELFRTVLSPEARNMTVYAKLFVWDALVSFLASLDVITRVEYTNALPAEFTNVLLNLLFTLLPQRPDTFAPSASLNGSLTAETLFTKRFTIQESSETTPEHYVCNLFYRTAYTLPSAIRQWYMSLPKFEAQTVHAYFETYLSPLLLQRELSSLGRVKKGRLTVRVIPQLHEVVAGYRFEEMTLSLRIALPTDYPLSKPTVGTEKSMVAKDVMRRWLLLLMRFLDNQNGLMLDGILQWKRNIDNHLDGIEDCTICMMTVSSTNYSLPKIRCRQCKKRFHGDCLYKWFNSSNNPTCPLCRSPFYY